MWWQCGARSCLSSSNSRQGLTLKLIYQAVERLTVSEHVYIAIARPKRGVGASALKLCRRLGLGLIVVTSAGSLEVLADPVPYAPRANTKKRGLASERVQRPQW